MSVDIQHPENRIVANFDEKTSICFFIKGMHSFILA